MSRGIDHLVLCVNDLKKARETYAAMGFTMTPQAQHPFGTGNTLAQFDGCFLEVLAVTQPEDIFEHDGDTFSFPAFNRDYLADREGMSMLVLDSEDETADRAEYLASGLRVHSPFDFQRQAKQPDGGSVTVGFSLTFVTDPALPDMAFFTCKQWRPELFWKPDYQRHANGATSIKDVFVVSPDITSGAAFLSAFAGAPITETAQGVDTIATQRGDLVVMTPDAFAARFPGAFTDRETSTPFFAGFSIACKDPDKTAHLWQNAGLEVHTGADGAWLAPSAGMGCVIVAT
jgi:hypothetical protein